MTAILVIYELLRVFYKCLTKAVIIMHLSTTCSCIHVQMCIFDYIRNGLDDGGSAKYSNKTADFSLPSINSKRAKNGISCTFSETISQCAIHI